MGYRKIRKLRTRAEKTLGARFDLKDFHAVLMDDRRYAACVDELYSGLPGSPAHDP